MRMKKYALICFAVVCLLFFMSVPVPAAKAALVIEPAYIKLNLTQNRSSGVFYIRNVGDKEERYRATAVHFIVSPKGGLNVIPDDEYSLAKWIKFNPKEFILPPKSSRMVRYSVIPQGKLKNREYWGAIQFVPLQGIKVKSKDVDGRSLALEIINVTLVPIYGLVDGTKFSGQFKQIVPSQDKDGLHLDCTIYNTGEGVLRLDGKYQLIDQAGSVVKEDIIKRLVVFPKNERIHQITINDKKLPTNKYLIRVELKSTNGQVKMSQETTYYYENK